MSERCVTCGDLAHEAGKCKRCNCGENEVSHAQTKFKPRSLREPVVSTVGSTCDKGRLVPVRKTGND